MSAPEKMFINFRHLDTDYHINLVQGGRSDHSVEINGVTYAVLGDKDKLKTACDILNSVPLHGISTSEELKGRLSTRSDLTFLDRKSDEIGIHTLHTQSLTPPENTKGSQWLQEENTATPIEGRLVAEKYWELNGKNEDHSGLIGFLKSRLVGEDQILLLKGFEEVLTQKNKPQENKEKLISLFEQLPRTFINSIEDAEGLQVFPMRTFAVNRKISAEDIQNLKDYMRASGFSGVVSLTSKGQSLAVKTTNINSLDEPFAMHSIGKVFTGMLLMIMIQKGVIDESMLDKPLQLETHVLDKLQEKGISKEQLEKITLRQVMQHTSGLTDYLKNYQDKIQESLDQGLPLPKIENPEELLQFADSTIKALKEGEEHYSNLGSLLFGLSIQSHYNEKYQKKLGYTPYNEILREHIIAPAKLTSFSEKRPSNAHFDDKDRSAYVYAGPAGGYWSTAEDLDKFGQWISKQYREEDPAHETSLHQLLDKHGREFYGGGVISHTGAVSSGSGYFEVFLNHDVSVAVLSDQSRRRGNFSAPSLYQEAIYRNILTEEEKRSG